MRIDTAKLLRQIKDFRDVLDVMEKSLQIMSKNCPQEYENPNDTYDLHRRIVEECERSLKDMLPKSRNDD